MNETKQQTNKKDKSPRVPQREKFKEELIIKEFEWTPNQREVIDCILDKKSKIIFISGRAGSGKSLCGVYCGLKLLSEKKLSDYIWIRSPLETSDSAGMGYIKGDIDQKFEPYYQVMTEKMSELLSYADTNKLLNDNRIHFQPINYIRGLSFNVKFIHVEEAANLTFNEYKLLLTRYGQYSKLVICGDFSQSDLPPNKRGAFQKIFEAFDHAGARDKGIFCFALQKEDVKRSDITNFIIDKLEELENSMRIAAEPVKKTKTEVAPRPLNTGSPMFEDSFSEDPVQKAVLKS